MAHQLHITVADSTHNDKFIYVQDLSQWDDVLTVKDRILQVLPPDSEKYVKIPFPKNGQVAITNVMLDIGDELTDLGDGFYQFHYSVSPNKEVYLEYGHYRVSRLLNKVFQKMAHLDYNDTTSIDTHGAVEITKQEKTLLHIWSLLQGVQAVARRGYGYEHATFLYNVASREFDRLYHKECLK